VLGSGDQQVGIPGQPAPRPLVAVVTDSGYNRLGGTQVQFAVESRSAIYPIYAGFLDGRRVELAIEPASVNENCRPRGLRL